MNKEIKLLKKVNCPENVIEHCKAVCEKAVEMAANFENVDMALLKKGALLHDIGRSQTHNIEHAIKGVEIARKYGYGDDVCNIIERHIGAGITEKEAVKLGLPKKSYVPVTIEEKIVAHSDNLLSGTKPVDIDFIKSKWRRKMDDPEDNIKRLIKLDNELKGDD